METKINKTKQAIQMLMEKKEREMKVQRLWEKEEKERKEGIDLEEIKNDHIKSEDPFFTEREI